jgi:hypothetical protein
VRPGQRAGQMRSARLRSFSPDDFFVFRKSKLRRHSTSVAKESVTFVPSVPSAHPTLPCKSLKHRTLESGISALRRNHTVFYPPRLNQYTVLQRNEGHSSNRHTLDHHCSGDRVFSTVECHGCCRTIVRQISTGVIFWHHDLLWFHDHSWYLHHLWRGSTYIHQVSSEVGRSFGGTGGLAILALAFIRFKAVRNACFFQPWHHAIDHRNWIRSSPSPQIFGPLRHPTIEDGEQAGTSNGGKRLSLNSGFHFRRGWPIRSAKSYHANRTHTCRPNQAEPSY